MTPEFAGTSYADKAEVAVPQAIGVRAGSFLRRKSGSGVFFFKNENKVRNARDAKVWVDRGGKTGKGEDFETKCRIGSVSWEYFCFGSW